MNKKYYLIPTIGILLLLLAIVSYGMLNANQTKAPVRVSVVLQDSQDDQWKAVKKGMEQAADLFGIKLSFETTARYISSNDLWSSAVSAVNNGAVAVILDLYEAPDIETSEGEANTIETKVKALQNKRVLLYGHEIEVPGLSYCSSISADDERIGQMLAEALWEDYGEDIRNLKIGVVSNPMSHVDRKRRMDAFTSTLAGYGVTPTWTMALANTLPAQLKSVLLQQGSDTDVVVTLGKLETDTAIDTMLDVNLNIPIYGEGYSEKAVYYLDKELLRCLVLPNDFSVGYMTVQKMANMLDLEKADPVDYAFEIVTVRTEDVYDEEYQPILFPLVE